MTIDLSSISFPRFRFRSRSHRGDVRPGRCERPRSLPPPVASPRKPSELRQLLAEQGQLTSFQRLGQEIFNGAKDMRGLTPARRYVIRRKVAAEMKRQGRAAHEISTQLAEMKDQLVQLRRSRTGTRDESTLSCHMRLIRKTLDMAGLGTMQTLFSGLMEIGQGLAKSPAMLDQYIRTIEHLIEVFSPDECAQGAAQETRGRRLAASTQPAAFAPEAGKSVAGEGSAAGAALAALEAPPATPLAILPPEEEPPSDDEFASEDESPQHDEREDHPQTAAEHSRERDGKDDATHAHSQPNRWEFVWDRFDEASLHELRDALVQGDTGRFNRALIARLSQKPDDEVLQKAWKDFGLFELDRRRYLQRRPTALLTRSPAVVAKPVEYMAWSVSKSAQSIPSASLAMGHSVAASGASAALAPIAIGFGLRDAAVTKAGVEASFDNHAAAEQTIAKNLPAARAFAAAADAPIAVDDESAAQAAAYLSTRSAFRFTQAFDVNGLSAVYGRDVAVQSFGAGAAGVNLPVAIASIAKEAGGQAMSAVMTPVLAGAGMLGAAADIYTGYRAARVAGEDIALLRQEGRIAGRRAKYRKEQSAADPVHACLKARQHYLASHLHSLQRSRDLHRHRLAKGCVQLGTGAGAMAAVSTGVGAVALPALAAVGAGASAAFLGHLYWVKREDQKEQARLKELRIAAKERNYSRDDNFLHELMHAAGSIAEDFSMRLERLNAGDEPELSGSLLFETLEALGMSRHEARAYVVTMAHELQHSANHLVLARLFDLVDGIVSAKWVLPRDESSAAYRQEASVGVLRTGDGADGLDFSAQLATEWALYDLSLGKMAPDAQATQDWRGVRKHVVEELKQLGSGASAEKLLRCRDAASFVKALHELRAATQAQFGQAQPEDDIGALPPEFPKNLLAPDKEDLRLKAVRTKDQPLVDELVRFLEAPHDLKVRQALLDTGDARMRRLHVALREGRTQDETYVEALALMNRLVDEESAEDLEQPAAVSSLDQELLDELMRFAAAPQDARIRQSLLDQTDGRLGRLRAALRDDQAQDEAYVEALALMNRLTGEDKTPAVTLVDARRYLQNPQAKDTSFDPRAEVGRPQESRSDLAAASAGAEGNLRAQFGWIRQHPAASFACALFELSPSEIRSTLLGALHGKANLIACNALVGEILAFRAMLSRLGDDPDSIEAALERGNELLAKYTALLGSRGAAPQHVAAVGRRILLAA